MSSRPSGSEGIDTYVDGAAQSGGLRARGGIPHDRMSDEEDREDRMSTNSKRPKGASHFDLCSIG